VSESGRCGACAKDVATGRRACPHCGEPKPFDPAGAPGFRLSRCPQCFKPVSVAAEACAQCVAARQPQFDTAAMTVGAKAQPVPAAPAPAVSTPARRVTAVRCRSCGNPLLPGQTACIVCRVPRQTTGVRCGTCGRALTPAEIVCPVCLPVEAALAVPQLHCKTCDGVVQPGQKPCPHCQALDPAKEYQAPAIVLPRDRSRGLGLRLGLGALALLAIAAVGGGALLQDKERRDRIRMAYGASATDALVATVEQDAEAIGVSTDVLVRVRRVCIARPRKQPGRDVLAAARGRALAAGQNGDLALVEAARAACKPRSLSD